MYMAFTKIVVSLKLMIKNEFCENVDNFKLRRDILRVCKNVYEKYCARKFTRNP